MYKTHFLLQSQLLSWKAEFELTKIEQEDVMGSPFETSL